MRMQSKTFGARFFRTLQKIAHNTNHAQCQKEVNPMFKFNARNLCALLIVSLFLVPAIHAADNQSTAIRETGRAYYFLNYLAKGVPTGGYDASPYLPEGMNGIGQENAQRIWLQAQALRRGSSDDVSDLASATLSAASGLFGRNSAEYDAVNNAWKALNVTAPAAISEPTTAPYAVLARGENYGCAIKSDNTLWCWGSNANGRLGDGTTTTRTTPVHITLPDPGTITHVSCGRDHTCASVAGTNGGVFCWGNNNYGQLGNGTTTSSLVPARVAGISAADVVDGLATGQMFSCAVVNKGARCWGYNYHGNLGDGTKTTRKTPVQVYGLGDQSGVTAIVAGAASTQAIVNGGVLSWGSNDYSAYLGSGLAGTHPGLCTTTYAPTYTEDCVKPVAAIGLETGVTALTRGGGNGFAIKDGALYAWGTKQLLLGLGASTPTGCITINGAFVCTQAVPVPDLSSGVTAITAGASMSDHACAIANGYTYCWGTNGSGEIGDNTTTNRTVPTLVKDFSTTGYLTGALNIASGGHVVCASTSQSVQCWGLNGTTSSGILGIGTNTYPQQCGGAPYICRVPVPVVGMP